MINDQARLLMEKELQSSKKASIAVGVVTKNGREISGNLFEEISGVDIGDYLFEIGSTTKTFTSLLLAKLAHQNILSLDEPISTYKPEYKNALSHRGKEITLRHLSTHRSGLPREAIKIIRKRMKEHKQDRDNPYKHFSSEDMHHFFTDFDLKREIEKKWGYSNIGIGLLGNILGDILGMTYEEAVHTHILAALGMNDTGITLTPEQMERYVKAYNKKGKRIPPLEIPAMGAAGALKSTIHDMLTYLECQMGLKDNPLQEAITMTHQIQADTAWKQCKMGLGWFIDQQKWSADPIIHHGGTTIGFHTYCGFIKEKQIGIVIFSTIQLSLFRIFQILLNLQEGINENIAKTIFINI